MRPLEKFSTSASLSSSARRPSMRVRLMTNSPTAFIIRSRRSSPMRTDLDCAMPTGTLGAGKGSGISSFGASWGASVENLASTSSARGLNRPEHPGRPGHVFQPPATPATIPTRRLPAVPAAQPRQRQEWRQRRRPVRLPGILVPRRVRRDPDARSRCAPQAGSWHRPATGGRSSLLSTSTDSRQRSMMVTLGFNSPSRSRPIRSSARWAMVAMRCQPTCAAEPLMVCMERKRR